MKNKNRQIVLLDKHLSMDKCGKILDNAERIIAMLDRNHVAGVVETVHLKETGNTFPASFTVSDTNISFHYTPEENEEAQKVMMMTHHEPGFFKQGYSYLGGKYFIERTATLEDKDFDISLIQLN